MKLNHYFTKPSQAYAAAATKVGEELALLAASLEGKDCREATWSQAEELHALAARLEEVRKQFVEREKR